MGEGVPTRDSWALRARARSGMEMCPCSGMWSKAFQSRKMFHAATSASWGGGLAESLIGGLGWDD
jgi:hypothetical protein